MTNLEKLCASLKDGEGALITDEINRRYFTDFPSSDGFLFAFKDGAVFATDSRYIEAAQNKIKNCQVLETGVNARVKDIAEKHGCKKIYIQSEITTVSQIRSYEKALSDFEIISDDTLDNMISDLRMVKSEEEKEKIIKAQRIAEKAFEHILSFIKPGVSEKDISLELDFFMLKNGAEALSFETIAVSGKNSSMPHGVPGEKKIENGDFITMDFGAVVEGYHSDMTRTVAVGSVSEKQRSIYNIVLRAKNACLAGLKEGMTGKEADAIARDIIAAEGYGKCFGHGTGHGVGVEIHEKPTLSPRNEKPLKRGEIVTVEPGIYLPGEFGVRIEDMAFITPDGCENLTKAPEELIIL